MATKKKASAIPQTLDDLIAGGIRYQAIPVTDSSISPAPQERTWGEVAQDVGVSALKSAIAVPEMAVGVADLVTGGRAGRFLENEDGVIGFRPKQAKALLDEHYSDEQKEAFRKVQAAEGLGDTFMATISNPSVVGHTIIESLASMGAGGVLARSALKLAPAMGGVAAAAIGEGVVGAGLAAEQIRQETEDGLLTGRQAGLAAGTGALTSGFALLGGKIAQKLGIADVDTMLAGASTSPAAAKGLTRMTLEGALAEGLLEELPQSVSETVLQNLALERPLDEGVNQAAVLGLLAGGAMGGGANLVNGLASPAPAPAPAGPTGRAAAVAPPVVAPAPPSPPPTPEPAHAQALLDHANKRAAEINAKAKGSKEQKVKGANGEDVTIPAVQPQFLTPEEKEEQAFLKEHGGDAARLAQVYPEITAPQATAATSITGTDMADMLAPADNPLLARGREIEADRQSERRTDAALARMEREAGRDAWHMRERAPREAEEEEAAPAAHQEGDILNPKGEPFKNKLAAKNAQRKHGGTVLAVAGGFAVRPDATTPDLFNASTHDAAVAPAVQAPDQAAAPAAAPGLAGADAASGAGAPVHDAVSDSAAELTLPKDLAGAKPRYSYGPKAFNLNFDSELDRAAYVIAEAKTSSRDADYLKFVMDATGLDEAGARAYGQRVKASIKAQAKDAEPGELKVPKLASAAPAAPQGDWRRFSSESKTLNIPRADMPQIKAAHRGAMVNFLKARGIEHEAAEVDPSTLKPTQAEYSEAKVQKAREFADTDRSILVSSDDHVLDGHHQWLARGADGQPVKVIRLKAPIAELLPLAHEFPSSTVDESSAAAPAPPAPATLDPVRQKAIDRIARGTAYFSTAEKADDFISKSGLADTHEHHEPKPGRFVVREKASATPAPAPAASAGPKPMVEIRADAHAAENNRDGAPSSLDNNLIASLFSFSGAPARWERARSEGRTDADLKAEIGAAFGISGGGPHANAHAGGDAPKFWHNASGGIATAHGKPTLGGSKLVAEVRRVLGIPQPVAEKPTKETALQRRDRLVAEREGGQPKQALPVSQEAFAEALEAVASEEDPRSPFKAPAKTTRAEEAAKAAGVISQEAAAQRLKQWKAHALAQGKTNANAGRVVLSLFDTTGVWSQPWRDAGYEVHQFDLQDGIDINDFSVEYLTETLGLPPDVYAILAAPPCTDFSSSGAHAWKAKDADGRTEASVELVRQTLRTVEFFKPVVWTAENPVGRIGKLTGLPAPRLTFQPNNYGDPYTKRTLLWGDFNEAMPLANVEPVEGSKMTEKLSGSDKYGRSVTPEGFAYAYFMANNAVDMPVAERLAREFRGLDRQAVQKALDTGSTEAQIRTAVEDAWNDADVDGANQALKALSARRLVQEANGLRVGDRVRVAPDEPVNGVSSIGFEGTVDEIEVNAPPAYGGTAIKVRQDDAKPDGRGTGWVAASRVEKMPAPAKDAAWSSDEETALLGLIGRNGGVVTKDMGGHWYAEVAVSNNDTKGVRAQGKTSLSAKRALLKKLGDEASAAAPARAVSANTIFTEDAAEKARAVLKRKLGTLNSGIDPELMQAGLTLAGYHIEKGARTFAAFARAMVADMGAGVRPYLKSWYMGVKYDPRASAFTGMDDAAAVESADVDNLTAEADTGDEVNGNAAQQLDRASARALEGAPAQDVRPADEGGDTGAGADRGGRSDGSGNAAADDAGGNPGRGVGSDTGAAPVPARGTRANAEDAPKRRVPRPARTDAGAVEPGHAGGLTPDTGANPAPNAPAIPAPQPSAADFTITDELGLGEGGQKTKFKNNVAAIRLVRELEASGRMATPDEQAVLARYVGWGGLPQAFDAKNADWAKEFAEISELMSEEELAAARQSTRYAHYTSREIVQDGIYAALRHFGFTGGKTLEAGAGVGNFLGLMPADMRSAGRFTAIEREPFSSAIARNLYPQQNVQRADFTEFKGNDAYFDAAVGNPPFASDTQTDRSGRKHLSGLSLHNYFFAKSVDMLREGGILAQVVTNSFLDAKSDRARKYISDRVEFLGAIRLPNNAFAKNANTEVTTDLIFLKKRPDGEIGGKAAREDAKRWLNTGTYRDSNGKAVALNQYFIDNPSMMLGDFGAHGTMYGPEHPALVARAGQDTLALLKEAVGKLPAGVYKSIAETASDGLVDAAVVALKNPDVKEGGYFVDGNKLMQRLPDLAGEARGREITPSMMWTAKTSLGEAGFERIKALAGMRATVRGLIAAEMADVAADMKALRAKLNEQYDAFRNTHGLINDPGTLRVFDDDPDFPLLASLEHGYTPAIGPVAAKRMGIKPTKSTAKKGPIFTQRVVAARQAVQKVETPADALTVSMAERGRLDAAYIGQLLGMEPEAVLRDLSSGDKPLLFRDPATDEYVLRDAYLSGNVRAKLAQAKQAGMFANVSALEAVQPEDVGSHEIVARLGSPWVPTSVYRDFAQALFGEESTASVTYLKANSSFQISVYGASDVARTNTWGTQDYPGDALLQSVMNNRSIKVTYRDSEGKTHTDVDATEKANTKAQEVRDKFSDWLFTDPERAELLTKAYNETNNNYVTRVYDGGHMTFPGKVPNSVIKFRRHQRNAIARIVQDRTALLDHVVGAGKTFTVVAGAMELKRTGLARKPMVAVPNHLVKQWAADFYRLYPGANILTATKKDFEKANRRKFLAKIATGEWDAVVIAHSSFGFIKPSAEFEAEFNGREVRKIMATITAVADGDGDKQSKRRTVKQLEAMKERLENRIKALRDKPMDDLLDFEQIGVDQLFVDEAHLFKNLMFTTKMQGVAGLNDPAGSQRAYDMYVKTNQVMERNGRGQGVVFATGTPVSNSLAEMYHMMRYLMPRQMAELGFESFDAWANTYASVEQVWMQAPSGDGFKAQNRMSNFVNTPELLRMFDQVSDTVTMEDIKAAYREENDGAEFPLPKLKGGRRTPVSLEKSPAQNAYMADIAKRAKAIETRRGPPKKGDDNILVVMGDARKAAMDIRLVDPDATVREPGGRIDRATDEVMERYRKFNSVKGAQIVFSDLGTPIKHAKTELKEYEALQARIAAGNDDVAASATLGNEAAMAIMEDAEAAQAELEAMGADWLSAVKAALRGFSVYDDFKAALIEKGIPEAEIAFIHDYNTDDQKAGLFRKVNAGQVRVLMGSTAKLGAGTNVQERLVAEHHLDVPWRPSDVEQREGRIERQGNRLMTEWPDFEIEILAYVTRDTLDMRMWQVQETKLKMINQLRARKIGREIDNAFEDMELSAGEMQAAATGDINLLKEIQLRNDVKKLEQRRRAFDGQKNDLISRKKRNADSLRSLPAQLAEAEAEANHAAAYMEDVRNNRPAFKMNIDGKDFTDASEAQAVLRELDEATEEHKALNGEVTERKKALSVTIDGELIKNRAVMAELFASARGDVHPIAWQHKGETYRRRTVAANAIRARVLDSIADENVQQVGTLGPYAVAVEGSTDRNGHPMLEVTLSRDGKVALSNVISSADTAAAPGRVIGVAENLLESAVNEAGYLRRQLEHAKRNAAELDKVEMAGEWPDQHKLDAARAAHKAVLAELKKKDGAAPAAQFSLGDQDGRGMPLADVQALVKLLRGRWENAPEIEVVDSLQEAGVPRELRIQDIMQRSQGTAGQAEGVWYSGKAYLVAGAMKSPKDVARVLFHEVLGHYGLQGTFGDGLAPILNQIAGVRRGEVAAKAKQYGLDINDQAQRLKAAEEVLAEMAEKNPDIGFVRRAIAVVRAWLRRHVPGFAAMKVSDDEIVAQYLLPARRFVERGGESAPRSAEPQPAFSIDGQGGARDNPSHGRAQTSQDADRNLRVLDGAIARHLGVPAGVVGALRPYDARVLPGDAELRQIAESFGSRIQGFGLRAGLLKDAEKKYGFFNGVRTGGVIFIRDGGQDRPHLAILGHELAHELATKRPDLYDALVTAIRPYVDPKKYGAEFVNSAVAKDAGDNTKKREEFIGEVLSDGFMDRDFWKALGAKNPSLLRKIGSMVLDLLDTILSASGYTKRSEQYLTDYKAVMKIAGEVMAEFGVQREAPGETAFSRLDTAPNDPRPMVAKAREVVSDLFNVPGKLNWWHKSVGTQYNLAQRSAPYKRVFDRVQDFLNDVSYHANQAAELAPNILPKLDTWRDVFRSPVSAEDNKAIAAPIFEGTLAWRRDETGKPVRMTVAEAAAGDLTIEQKAQRLLRGGHVTERMLKMWRGLPLEQYETIIENKFEREMLAAGVVWSDAELVEHFNLTPAQISLYREFRAATDQSLATLAISDMVRFGGHDVADAAEAAMETPDVNVAAVMLRDHLLELAEIQPDRRDVLIDTANKMIEKADRVQGLMDRGYAPLSRFGQYSLDVVDADGNRVYFGLFESRGEAARMARAMRANYEGATIRQGTMSQEAYKLFAGVSPETLEIFGGMLGLEVDGDGAKDRVFQEYIKLAKGNRSAMKRLIERKGVAGFSEDAGRVLAGFIYSNARQTASGLHMGAIAEAANDIPNQQGELKDAALKLMDYIKNPVEEAAAFRGLLFAQYLGGSLASAMVNMTQPVAVTTPYLSQFGGVRAAAAEMKSALVDVFKKSTGEAALDAALKKAEEDGIVAPQEVHQLMAQAQGRASLKPGDGTTMGDLRAKASNTMSRVSLAWGKAFGAAEQFNRRVTFIAAYRLARKQGIPNPAAFAEKTIAETQFIYNKGNKPRWARGALGGTIFTFKQYSISYMELLSRMAASGPEGKKAALLALGVLFLMGGAGGMPFVEDAEDVADALMQRLGYNFSTKQKRKEFFADLLGKEAAEFLEQGVSGLPGAPIDVSGRLGLGNLIPGTGLLLKKSDYSRDIVDAVGPAGDLIRRGFQGANALAAGQAGEAAAVVSPVAARNVLKALDMANTGLYRDERGRKVLDVDGFDALAKAIGFQPSAVAQVQEGSYAAQRMIALNKITEADIAGRWAVGLFEGDQAKVAAARQAMLDWNRKNPESPIRINMGQVLKRVRAMRTSKEDRIAATAPREIRAAVRRELAAETVE